MHYIALATDYDGTIAHDGVVDAETVAALERLRAGARKVIMVTGRELPDLERVCERLDLFDLVVCENGALIYNPKTREETLLCAPPDERFVERLRAANVQPLSVGRGIVATWEPNETTVLEAIRDLGLELKITFNKGAVMVLPGDVTKASGLAAAIELLNLSPLDVVGVGDAENDMAMLEFCGFSVAVGNALPTVKERAALVTEGARGAGVAELVDRILTSDLRDVELGAARQHVELARREDAAGTPITWRPRRQSLLLTGHSGGGKSTLTLGVLERLQAAGFRACVIDPEGDYENTAGMVQEGTADNPPDIGQILELIEKSDTGLVVNLLAVKLDDRPGFLGELLPKLMASRTRNGRPHVVVVDEAHHMLPADWDPGSTAIPPELHGFLFITTRPQLVARRVLDVIDTLLVVGAEPEQSLAAFTRACGLAVPADVPPIETGQALMLCTDRPGQVERVQVIPGVGVRRRHLRKYAEGELGADASFYFRGPDGQLNLRAQNLMLFMQLGEGVDEATWQFHRQNGDYSSWMREILKDHDLADEVVEVEVGPLALDEARQAVRAAIERRYTLPG